MKKFLVFAIVVGAVAMGVIMYAQKVIYHTTGMTDGEQIVEIVQGTSASTIATQLAQKRIILSRWAFLYYLRAQNLRGEIKAGTYTFAPHLTIPDIATIITTGKSVRRDIRVTFPEGFTIKEMAQTLTKAGFDGAQFLESATHLDITQLAQEFSCLKNIPQNMSLEGYLFPDTYFFLPETTEEEIIHKLLETFCVKFLPLLNQQNDVAHKYNLHELVTLASIVEAEVRKDDERAIVAGLFYNRLEVGMALQSDATLDYIFGNSKVKHTLKDTQVRSPYNTYQVAGLPPGPIGNPGITSLTAVVSPQKTEYMYFLNNAQTGETVFATTFDEHVRNKANNGL